MTKTYSRKHGVWIYDSGDLRAIVYKVGNKWNCRAGTRKIGMTAPDTEFLEAYGSQKMAESQALAYLKV